MEEFLFLSINQYHQQNLEIESSGQVIWVILHLQGPHNIILGAFYTPPNSTLSLWEDLSECLIQIRQKFSTVYHDDYIGRRFQLP